MIPAFLLCAALLASPADDPDLALGLRQVAEGDFESAIPTLEAVAHRLDGDPVHRRERADALLHLGVAQVALDRNDDARGSFQAALRENPDLRVTTAAFSPKVVRAFEDARAALRASAPPPRRSHRGAWIAGGLGAAGAATALALRGGGEEDGTITASNARFGTPVIVCPDGSDQLPLPFTILVDVDATAATRLTAVTATAIIEASAMPAEIGFASSQEARATPQSLAAGRTTVAIATTLTCGNGRGDAPRFNEWSGHVTLTTPGGSVTAATVDRMRVNVP